MTPQFAKARTFSFFLQEPQGEVLIITSVSSFSVFIQKPDHTPKRQTEEHTHTVMSTFVQSILSNRPVIYLYAWYNTVRAGDLHGVMHTA